MSEVLGFSCLKVLDQPKYILDLGISIKNFKKIQLIKEKIN